MKKTKTQSQIDKFSKSIFKEVYDIRIADWNIEKNNITILHDRKDLDNNKDLIELSKQLSTKYLKQYNVKFVYDKGIDDYIQKSITWFNLDNKLSKNHIKGITHIVRSIYCSNVYNIESLTLSETHSNCWIDDDTNINYRLGNIEVDNMYDKSYALEIIFNVDVFLAYVNVIERKYLKNNCKIINSQITGWDFLDRYIN